MEKQEGVTSTFFVTIKNFTDETDIGYYSGANIESLKKIKELGFDLGSHSVSHSKQFEFLQLGDPSVNSANYQPLKEKTILGEVKVSKELLDRDIPGQRTVGFRAGELAYPRRLLTALSAAGLPLRFLLLRKQHSKQLSFFRLCDSKTGERGNIDCRSARYA